MPTIVVAPALSRWLPAAATASGELSFAADATTLGDALEQLFTTHPTLRGYVVDEHGSVRHHVAVFVDGDAIGDKTTLRQPLAAQSEVYVMQALSGG